MAIMKMNRNPADKDLRNFGWAGLIVLTVVSLLLYFVKGIAIQWSLIVFTVGFIIFLTSIISIKTTKIIYLCLTVVTKPIGMVLSFVLLAIFYFLLLTPVGLFFRLIGRDPLFRKFDSSSESYWIDRREASLKRYFRQF